MPRRSQGYMLGSSCCCWLLAAGCCCWCCLLLTAAVVVAAAAAAAATAAAAAAAAAAARLLLLVLVLPFCFAAAQITTKFPAAQGGVEWGGAGPHVQHLGAMKQAHLYNQPCYEHSEITDFLAIDAPIIRVVLTRTAADNDRKQTCGKKTTSKPQRRCR